MNNPIIVMVGDDKDRCRIAIDPGEIIALAETTVEVEGKKVKGLAIYLKNGQTFGVLDEGRVNMNLILMKLQGHYDRLASIKKYDNGPYALKDQETLREQLDKIFQKGKRNVHFSGEVPTSQEDSGTGPTGTQSGGGEQGGAGATDQVPKPMHPQGSGGCLGELG